MRFFRTKIWAKAFLDASDDDAEESFLYLKALASPVKSMQGIFYGHGAIIKLENILRTAVLTAHASLEANAALAANAEADSNSSIETSIRFICLLAEKKCLSYIDKIIKDIEQTLDSHNGILDVIVESALPFDDNFEKDIEKNIRVMTDSNKIKIIRKINKKLLGGYLIRMNSLYIDASLKQQLEKMKTDFSFTGSGGING